MISRDYTRRLYRLAAIGCLMGMVLIRNQTLSQDPAIKQPVQDDAKIFEWFDQLGFKDYSNLPLVKVTTGWWSQSGNDDPENRTIYAFLLNETEDGFSVFTLGLNENSFKITAADSPAHTVVRFERESLAEYARKVLREHAERNSRDRDVWWRFRSQLNEGTEFVVLARACAAQRELELSRQLMDAARDLLKHSSGTSKPNATFRENLSDELANMTMWNIILEFGNTEISRTALLAKLDALLKNYPDSPHFDRAKLTATMLRTMLAEEQEHIPPSDFEKLTTEEKVSELIFRLRDQNGQQWSQPGECDIFNDFMVAEAGEYSGEAENVKLPPRSPAHQLVDIGFDAVPQLIEALEDQRLTRSVGFHRDFYFSHHVLRVGDCAERILCRIANRNFYRRNYTNGAMVKDGEQLTVKKQIEDWWSEVQTKGEKQVLVDVTKLGDDNSAYQAGRLLEKYPDAALDAIAIGARNARSTWVRNQMIAMAGTIGQTAIEFLMEQMDKSPELSSRVAAAIQIDNLVPLVAVKSMIREWKSVTDIAGKTSSKNGEMTDGVEELIQFLATKDSLECIKALHDDYRVHATTTRFKVVTAFGTDRRSVFSSSIGSGGALTAPGHVPPVGELVQNEIESLLITALGDTDRREGLSGSWGDFRFSDPRICDVAGFVLSGRLPERYEFTLNAAPDVVESQRLKAINQWRKRLGIELLPEFEPRKIRTTSRLPRFKACCRSPASSARGARGIGLCLLHQNKEADPFDLP